MKSRMNQQNRLEPYRRPPIDSGRGVEAQRSWGSKAKAIGERALLGVGLSAAAVVGLKFAGQAFDNSPTSVKFREVTEATEPAQEVANTKEEEQKIPLVYKVKPDDNPFTIAERTGDMNNFPAIQQQPAYRDDKILQVGEYVGLEVPESALVDTDPDTTGVQFDPNNPELREQ